MKLYQLTVRGGNGLGGMITFRDRWVFDTEALARSDKDRFLASCRDDSRLLYLDDSMEPEVNVAELEYKPS